LGAGYDNAYYNYKATEIGYTPAGFNDVGGNPVASIVPSLGGTLNRIEQRAHVEGLWGFQPDTKAILGYRFTDFDYTEDQDIGGFVQTIGGVPIPGTVFFPVNANTRNNREHTFYVGAMHDFSPQFSGALRAGASYTDYYNDPNSDSTWTPYVNGSLTYKYAPESSVTGGISYDRNATDIVGFGFSGGNGSFTQDAESFVIFAAVNHRLGPNLFANVNGQFQNSTYNGGTFNNQTEQYYLVGLELEYRFNPWFSTHLGYNYDNLQSQIESRGFDRNRVYVGITASY
jgi:hypothetical protein